MTALEAEDVLKGLVVSAWDTATVSAPMAHQNIDFSPPQSSIWGRLTQFITDSSKTNVGPVSAQAQRFRTRGFMTLQIFVPQGRGTTTAKTIGKAVEDAMKTASNAALQGIRVRDVVTREIGPDDSWFQVNTEFTFQFDETL